MTVYLNSVLIVLKKQLPVKYYLEHFNELIRYIHQVCQPLLQPSQRELLQRYSQLPEPELCLLVRFYSRKTAFLDVSSLSYSELAEIPALAERLEGKGLLTPAKPSNIDLLLSCLSKTQLVELSTVFQPQERPNLSANKASWVAAMTTELQAGQWQPELLPGRYYCATHQSDFDYFLFLFFGKLGGSLSQFSMRDLGLLATRDDSQTINAHFEEYDEAQSAYHYAARVEGLKQISAAQLNTWQGELLKGDFPEVVGHYAQSLFADYSYKLAKLSKDEPEHYEALLALSPHPKAREALIRHCYSAGQHQWVQEQLEDILDGADDESLMLFASDFYQRKFHKKRTSLLTDMLRASRPALVIDEAFKGHTEQGVVDYYRRQGDVAVHGENALWLSLFGLTFWHELYINPKSTVANAFSRSPKVLKEGRFYSLLASEIEARLEQVNTKQAWQKWLIRQVTQYYQQPNRLFTWHEDILAPLTLLIEHGDIAQLHGVMRLICQHFEQLRSGFPDLMIIDKHGKLRFEEIKAQGDSLSRNQVITLSKLSDVGLDVRVQAVQWNVAADQPYVIVDIETTGGNKDYDRITEIAMIKVQNGQVIDSWTSLVNPDRNIPQRIQNLTGINNAMVASAPIITELLEAIAAFTQDAIFVAHNVNFDYGFIRQAFARHQYAFSRAKLCTVQLARKHLPGLPSYSLGKLCQQLGIELTQHHRAMADANATAELFLQINEIRQAQ